MQLVATCYNYLPVTETVSSNKCSNLSMSPHKWHPWRHLRQHFPHVDVHFVDQPTHGQLGRLTRDGIEIDKTSTQTERRSTLSHEIGHVERGPVPDDPFLAAREEQVVEELTARRMIRLPDLVDAVLWCQGRTDYETAEELWVDPDILLTRVRTLTPGERKWVEHQIARRTN